MDIVYAGGIPLHNINQINIPKEVVEKYNEIFDVRIFTQDIFYNLIENPTETIETVVEKYVSVKCDIDDVFLEMLIKDFYFLHNYIVSYYRLKILEQAAESCGQLYIYGGGYDASFFRIRKMFILWEISHQKKCWRS